MKKSLVILSSFFVMQSAFAEDIVSAKSANVTAELLSQYSQVQAGQTFYISLKTTPDEGFHTYWINPGSAGSATKATWITDNGVTISELKFPTPEKKTHAGITSYYFEKPTHHLCEVTVPTEFKAPMLKLKVNASWLSCNVDSCNPGKAELNLTIPITPDAPIPSEASTEVEEAIKQLPVSNGGISASAKLIDQKWVVSLTVPRGAETSTYEATTLYAITPNVIADESEQTQTSEGEIVTFEFTAGTKTDVEAIDFLLFGPINKAITFRASVIK